jgi:hypothetical protein
MAFNWGARYIPSHQHSPQHTQEQSSVKQLQTHVRTQKYEFNMQYGKTGSSEKIS